MEHSLKGPGIESLFLSIEVSRRPRLVAGSATDVLRGSATVLRFLVSLFKKATSSLGSQNGSLTTVSLIDGASPLTNDLQDPTPQLQTNQGPPRY